MRALLVVGVVAAAVQGAMAQPAPKLDEACKQFAAAAERIQAPSVPIGPRGVWLRHADVAKGCAAKPQTGDPAKVQDAANEIAVAAAPYAEARP
jgi:hypothetical protein